MNPIHSIPQAAARSPEFHCEPPAAGLPLSAPASMSEGFCTERARREAQAEAMTSACLNPLCPWRALGRGAAGPLQAARTDMCLNPLCPHGISAAGSLPQALRVV